MIGYNAASAQHEAFVARWWADLSERDRELTFHSSLHRLGIFLNYFNSQAGLMFDYDESGIWFAAWTQDLCDGCTFSMWIRDGKRRLPSAWKNLRIAYNLVFTRYKRVVGYSRQGDLHAQHLKLGYEYCGRIPDIMDGNALYIYSMSKEQWEARDSVARKVRAERKMKRKSLNGVVHQGAA